MLGGTFFAEKNKYLEILNPDVCKFTQIKLFHINFSKTLRRFYKLVIVFKNSQTTTFAEQLLAASDLYEMAVN